MAYKLAEQPEMSDIGPFVLACFAFLVLAQGLMYIFKPEQTGRALTASKSKIRTTGYWISLLAVVLLYASYRWWLSP